MNAADAWDRRLPEGEREQPVAVGGGEHDQQHGRHGHERQRDHQRGHRVMADGAPGRCFGQQEAGEHERDQHERFAGDGDRSVAAAAGRVVATQHEHVDVLQHGEQPEGDESEQRLVACAADGGGRDAASDGCAGGGVGASRCSAHPA